MRTLPLMASVIFLLLLSSCKEQNPAVAPLVIASGQMPAMVKDNSGNLNLVYGTSDSIMYSSSNDNGISFTSSALIDVLPELDASHTRGPQIAASGENLTVIACNSVSSPKVRPVNLELMTNLLTLKFTRYAKETIQ
jgi:hypothetical protein